MKKDAHSDIARHTRSDDSPHPGHDGTAACVWYCKQAPACFGGPFNFNQGAIYPALVRLEQHGWTRGSWSKTEKNREAKYYAITKAGLKALEEETVRWRQMSGVVEKLLAEEQ